MNFRKSYIGAAAIILGTMSVIAVFLNWYTLATGVIGMPSSDSGWGILTDGVGPFSYFPAIVLVLGAACIVMGFIEFTDMTHGNVAKSSLMDASFMMLGMMLLLFSYMTYSGITELGALSTVSMGMGAGLYVEIIACVGLIIAGLLRTFDFIKN